MLEKLPSEVISSVADQSYTSPIMLVSRPTWVSMLSGRLAKSLSLSAEFFNYLRVPATKLEGESLLDKRTWPSYFSLEFKTKLISIYISGLTLWRNDVVLSGSQLLKHSFHKLQEVEEGSKFYRSCMTRQWYHHQMAANPLHNHPLQSSDFAVMSSYQRGRCIWICLPTPR